MKKSLKKVLIIGLVISSNGLIGSEKSGKNNNHHHFITLEQQALQIVDGKTPGMSLEEPYGDALGGGYIGIKRDGIPAETPTNTNSTRLQQVVTAVINWWYGSTQKEAK